MIHLPTLNKRIRLLLLTNGIIVFFWLTPEDDSVQSAALLGLLSALVISLHQVLRWLGGREIALKYIPLGAALLGAIIGVFTSLTTASLMFLKNARHSHLYPDYPGRLIIAILERAPQWALVGALATFGLSLAWLALRQTPDAAATDQIEARLPIEQSDEQMQDA